MPPIFSQLKKKKNEQTAKTLFTWMAQKFIRRFKVHFLTRCESKVQVSFSWRREL